MKQQWSYMGTIGNFEAEEEPLDSEGSLVVKRIGRFKDLPTTNSAAKPKRRLTTAERLDLQSGGVIA